MDKHQEHDGPEPDVIDEPIEDRGDGVEAGLEPNEDGTLPVGG